MGSRAKKAKLKLALSKQGLAHVMVSLQGVAAMAVVDFLRDIIHMKHWSKVQNTSSYAIGLKSLYIYF